MVGDVHGISDRAASTCIHSVAAAICMRMDQFIQWPAADEISVAKQDFYVTHGFPCIMGLIDGSQVRINAPHPPANEVAFVNRKFYHSINVQIVCNSKMLIYDLDARWPGSTHDSFMLQNSHVMERFENGQIPNTWLLGDAGYALKKWLLVPYANAVGDGQLRYNRAHKHIRSTVERCNGVWKMRWRCLTKPIMFQPSRASRIIAACGALHNFAIKHGVDFDEELDADILDADEVRVVEGIIARNPDGVVARNELVRQVFTR